NAGHRQHADLRRATVSSAGRLASPGRADAFVRRNRTTKVMPRAAGRITTVSDASADAATITEKTGIPDPPLQVGLAIRSPTPLHVPAQMPALTAAPRTNRRRPTPATPAKAAVTGFNSGKKRAPS